MEACFAFAVDDFEALGEVVGVVFVAHRAREIPVAVAEASRVVVWVASQGSADELGSVLFGLGFPKLPIDRLGANANHPIGSGVQIDVLTSQPQGFLVAKPRIDVHENHYLQLWPIVKVS